MRFRKEGIDCMARANAERDILAALPGSWTRSRTDDLLAPKTAWTGASFSPDRRHLDYAAVRINRHYRDDTAVGEVHVVQRTIGVQENLLRLAADLFELRHEALEIARRQGEQKTIAGPI
jgi:hypothetical protein